MKILLPIDGSEFSKKAASVAMRIAKRHDSEILLIHVIAPTGQERKKWMEEGAEKLLRICKDAITNSGINADKITTIIEDGDPATNIVETAQLKGVDRIIMGTHGKTGIKKLAGSVTEKVLRKSKVLVLIVSPNYEISEGYLSGVEAMVSPYLAAVDIGATKITVSLINKQGIRIKVYQPVRMKGDNRTVPHQVDFLVGYACEKMEIEKNEIIALGISTCGPFEKHAGHLVLVAPNLCGGLAKQRGIIPNEWTYIPLESELSQIYNQLKIGNDGVTAVMAERLFGAGEGEDNIIYVTWSTGIGSGAYVDGRLIKGKNGNAPHIGHIFLVEGGPQCGCGSFGHLESLASGVAIARDYGGGSTAKEVFLAYRQGEKKAKKIIRSAVGHFVKGLASINAILDTEVFIIGGSVFMNNIDILMPMIKDEFYESFPALSKGVEFRPSALDKSLGDLAALCLVMPDEWIRDWQIIKPWEYAPEPIILD
jgi:glucokinase